MTPVERFRALLKVNVEDMLDSIGARGPRLRFLLSLLCVAPAAFFTARLLRFDRDIGARGIAQASDTILRSLYRGVTIECGTGIVPTTGGTLVLGNHPGLGDAIALLSTLDRDDVLIVGHDRPFFRLLPELFARIIPVPDEPRRRITVISAILDALEEGKLVLLYPAGVIEPDPLGPRRDGAVVGEWTEAVGNLICRARRRNQSFTIIEAMVAGVYGERSGRSRWVNAAATAQQRDRRALVHVLALGSARRAALRLRVAEPLDTDSSAFNGLGPQAVTELLRSRLEELALRPPTPGTRTPDPCSRSNLETSPPDLAHRERAS